MPHVKKNIARAGLTALLVSQIIIPTSSLAVPSGADIYFFIGNEFGQRYSVKSNGDGTFGPVTLAVTDGGSLRGGATEDFDEDGDLDLVGCNRDISQCKMYPQTGPGTFAIGGFVGPVFAIGFAEAGMAAADFDQDGHADAALGGQTNVVAIAFGDGTGNFPTFINTLTPQILEGPYLAKDTGDIDGNGYPDLLLNILGTSNTFAYLNTAGTFSGPTLLFKTTPAGVFPLALSVADFNGDGFLDVLAGGSFDGDVVLWKGNGTTSFSLAGTIHDFDAQAAVDNYDFDGDGDQDFVAVKLTTGEVSYFEANGDGTFKPPVLLGSVTAPAYGMAAPPQPPIRSTVEGTAFSDPNENGIQDIGEVGIELVALSLTGTDYLGNSVSLSTTSAADGSYRIEGVPIDDGSGYTLTATAPSPPPTLYSPITTTLRTASVPKENTTVTENFGYLLCTDADGDGFATEGGACGDVDCNDGDAAIHPGASESCDNVDNDCDGSVDEGFVGLGDACSAGIGECASTGQFVCDGTGNSTTCNAVAGTPTVEQCNGLDNDCNGIIDDEVDGDNDGLSDLCSDLCPGTTIPEVNIPSMTLKSNHYTIADGDTTFDLGESSSPDSQQFTLLNTQGCNCEQILDGSSSGKTEGLRKFGCTSGTIQSWISGTKDTCDFDGDGEDDC